MAQRTLFRTLQGETVGQNGLWLVFDSSRERDEALFNLVVGGGYNYFVRFVDRQGPALFAGYSDWPVSDCSGGIYVA